MLKTPFELQELSFEFPRAPESYFKKLLWCLFSLDRYTAADEISNAGFGKIFPAPSSSPKEEMEEDDDEIPSEFISKRELGKGRVSKRGDSLII